MDLTHTTEYDDGTIISEAVCFIGEVDEYRDLMETVATGVLREMADAVEQLAVKCTEVSE